MLPVPFAFSRMGVLLGIVTMAIVAYSNSLTSVLLLRAAGLTGHDSYEGVAYAIGGRVWKVSPLSSLFISSFTLLPCLPSFLLLLSFLFLFTFSFCTPLNSYIFLTPCIGLSTDRDTGCVCLIALLDMQERCRGSLPLRMPTCNPAGGDTDCSDPAVGKDNDWEFSEDLSR